MLKAYLDDSGSKDTPNLSIAGFVADELRWTKVEREWRECLDRHGAKFLHMREYTTCRGEFSGWTDQRRKDLIVELIEIIKSTVTFRIGALVKRSDYDEICGRTIGPIHTPFWLCFLFCLSLILGFCRENDIRDDIALIFDGTSESVDQASQWYSAVKKVVEMGDGIQFVSLTFADDKQVTPLQAADLLSYEFNKYHREGRLRKTLVALEGISGGFIVANRQLLENYAIKLIKLKPGTEEALREALTRGGMQPQEIDRLCSLT